MVAPQHVLSVNADLSIQLSDKTVRLFGVRVGKDPKACRDSLERLLKTASDIRLVPDDTAPQAPGAQLYYVEFVAMIDRSGPIWLDAGHMLISQKVAVVDPSTTFTRRAEYEATQRKVEQGKGPLYPND